MPSADLFPSAPRFRKKPRVLSHAIDAGNSDHGERTWAKLRCRNAHEWETHTDKTVTELKRGLPCPNCNAEPT